MRILISFLSGSFFGAGLLVSGMTDTAKVQGWLDIFGQWDPTLAFVMGGAIIPMAIAWSFTSNNKPAFGESFPKQFQQTIDNKLVIGSILFGMGWALAGLCPGPVIASLGFGGIHIAVFMGAMLTGMALAPHFSAQFERFNQAQDQSKY